jgi:TonB-linked SusC/RagA family outer membrane protein
MQFTSSLLLVICLQATAATSFGQKVNIKERNAKLGKIFKEIRKQTDYNFIYSNETLRDASPVTIDVRNASIRSVLDYCFKNQPLVYAIDSNVIVVRQKPFASLHREADPPPPVTGTVTDSLGNPLLGVTIKVRGSDQGTVTDLKGNFSLDVAANAVLIVSYVGYQSQRVTVDGRTTLHIVLSPASTGLEQVVVVGYGTQQKQSLTSAVSSIQGKEIVTTKNENVENMLTGKVAGLQIVQNTAEPGDFANNISIRGMGNPLIVVDGVEMPDFSVTGNNGDNSVGSSNILSRLDPNDIASISVLKDAAAAVYGVKAANGVILVTTKKGRPGAMQLSYSGTVGSQVPANLPRSVNAIQYMTLANQLAMHQANGGTIVYTPADFQAYTSGQKQSTDWYNAVFKKSALQQQHNLTATGGTENIQYFLSGGYTTQNGFLNSGDLNYKRYNVRSNVTSKFGKRITVNLNISAILDQKNSPAESFWWTTRETWRELPTQTIYANDNPKYLINGIVDGGNPVAFMNSNITGYTQQLNKFFNGSLSIDYEVPYIDGLVLRGFYSYNTQIQENKVFQKAFNLYTYDGSTQTYSATLNNAPSFVRRQYYEYPKNTDQFSLNYTHVFEGVHHVTALLLYEGNQQSADNFAGYRELSIPVDQLIAGNSANQEATQDGGGLYEYATNSFVGRVTYGYKGKYLAEFSFRDDASSKFAPGQKWGFFPSASVGWRISDEKFWKSSALSFLDNFKLRASYGVLGDDGSLYYQFLTGYNYPANGNYNQLPSGSVFNGSFVNAVQSTGLPNPNITWSTSHTFDVGADLDAWQGLVGLTIDYFRRNRTGLFASPVLQVPEEVGAALPQENINGDRTQGIDLQVNHRDHIGKFDYNITGTFSYARTQNTTYAESKHGNSYLDWRQNQADRNQGIQWGYGSAGQYQNYSQILNSPVYVNRGIVVGDYAYQDWNGDGQIDDNDTHPIAYGGTPNGLPIIPVITYGVTLSGSYDGFDLSLLFQGVGIYNVSYIEQLNIPLWGGGSALTQFLDDYHPEDPSADPFAPGTVWIPGTFAYTGTTANTSSAANFHSAAYVRLKSAEIGYTLPHSLLSHIGIKGVRVFVNGYNLVTFTKLKYVDPEHPSGTYGYLYPLDKLYNVGLNVNF